MKIAEQISGEVVCTACEHGPCVIGYMGKQETIPDKWVVPAEIAEALPSGCILPEEE